MTDVFTDHLSITTPVDDWPAMRDDVLPMFDSIGACLEYDKDGESLWRSGSGTCKAQRRGLVTMLSATGAFLVGLRAAEMFGAYLAAIGSHRHRVTRLDASMDVKCDAALVIAALVDKVESDIGLHVTRKRVLPGDCSRFVHRRPDGLDTGTVYLGPANADVRPCIYDKRQERIDKGLCDVGPLARFECRIKKGMGPTLRDAFEPTAIFWRFMGDVLPTPANAPKWSASQVGFVLPVRVLDNPAQRLVKRLDSSTDLRDMIRLAREVGPFGLSFLQSRIADLYGHQVIELAAVPQVA